MNKRNLLLQQLSKKMALYIVLKQAPTPPTGWIRAIRTALNMSLEQLGKKMSIRRQSVNKLEQREKDGTISVKSLKEAAKALDMHFVYGFVPKDGSLEALIERKANEIAKKIVLRTSNSMKLEDQENSKQRIEIAIKERAQSIINETPKILWD
ncbi:MAG: mobile mystery protein A [Bacteroidetes bacterium]|jgi:predicted DNA-binding mobile mystery protein A|nr:mobile mystery protein A [Bacteroidota bacterium]MBK9525151.1 mobile mystery protein A [Bacteroidota bacterium]MBK9543390.1 mobile mystery protein A [Bacteroidota bacterium]